MKTTIKLDMSKALDVEPVAAEQAVRLTLRIGPIVMGSMTLGKNSIGAILAAIEGAADVALNPVRSTL